MTSSYCIIVPHYQHARLLIAMLERLAQQDLVVFIVDDGSDAQTVEQLRVAIEPYPQVHLLKRAENGGKGAAMITGVAHAIASGYSHAISLDADGQHDINDIATLHALSKKMPASFITGRPIFGDDIPWSRLYGRMLTNSLVKMVTVSNMIKDAMCGMRTYPLATVQPLFNKLGYRTRMEFDVEILVRACWAGLDIRCVDTKVIYPEDGASHFNMVADNVRLVAMHTLLIVTGILRLPVTLWRRQQAKIRS